MAGLGKMIRLYWFPSVTFGMDPQTLINKGLFAFDSLTVLAKDLARPSSSSKPNESSSLSSLSIVTILPFAGLEFPPLSPVFFSSVFFSPVIRLLPPFFFSFSPVCVFFFVPFSVFSFFFSFFFFVFFFFVCFFFFCYCFSFFVVSVVFVASFVLPFSL